MIPDVFTYPDPHIGIEQGTVGRGFVRQERGYRNERKRTQPHTCPARPDTFSGLLPTGIIDDIIDDEHHDRYYHRSSQTAFAGNGTQRRADKEEDQTRKRERELTVQFDLVFADIAVVFVQQNSIVVNQVLLSTRFLQSRRIGSLSCPTSDSRTTPPANTPLPFRLHPKAWPCDC